MLLPGSIAVGAVKLAGVIASSYGAWYFYSTMPETKMRRELVKAFQYGGLCLKVNIGRGKNKKEVVMYPKVTRVTVSVEVRTVEFLIPTGLDPAEVYNHDWLLQQAFGEYIEVKNTVKHFTMKIYDGPIKQYKYDFQEIKKFVNSRSEYMHLPILAGKNREGLVVYDMAIYPHLLEAGETGSGKSVALRAIITTLLLLRGDQIELYLGDMKRSEFHVFRGIAKEVHMNKGDLRKMLVKIRRALQERGDLCDERGVSNILDLPKDIRPKFIVVAIDEVALLQKEGDSMDIIEEISAVGRALGVFLILAMQRPDKDVVDGKLKNNMTVRMAFRHADEINSRITIGSGEAAHIKQSEKGLMIHKLDGIDRVQSPLLSVEACRAILAHLKREDDTLQRPHKGGRKKAPRASEEEPTPPEELERKYKDALQEDDPDEDDFIEPQEDEEL